MSEDLVVEEQSELGPDPRVLAIRELVKSVEEAYDKPWYNSIDRLMRFTFGFAWDDERKGKGTKLPDYDHIDTLNVDVGAFRGMFVNNFIALNDTLQSDPKPEWPQLEELESELRQSLFLRLYRDKHWRDTVAETFLSGHSAGVSFVRHFYNVNSDGRLEIEADALSPLDVLWDAHEKDPRKARWIGYCFDLPVDEAVAAFPDHAELVKKHQDKRTYSGEEGVRRVRLFEYFSKTHHAVFLANQFDETTCLTYEPSAYAPWGRLPISCFVYLLVPGVKRPVGTSLLQLSSAVELKHWDARIKNKASQRTIEIWDMSQVSGGQVVTPDNPEEPITVNRIGGEVDKLGPVVQRIAPEELTQAEVTARQIAEQAFSTDSNTSNYQRNVMPSGDRTKYEVETYNASVSQLGAWRSSQTLTFLRDFVQNVVMLAAVASKNGHMAQMEIEYEGRSYPVNLLDDPRSWVFDFCAEQADCLIDETSIRATNQIADMEKALAKLNQLLPFVQSPTNPGGALSLDTFITELLTTLGEEDTEKWLVQQQVMPTEEQVLGDPSQMIPA